MMGEFEDRAAVLAAVPMPEHPPAHWDMHLCAAFDLWQSMNASPVEQREACQDWLTVQARVFFDAAEAAGEAFLAAGGQHPSGDTEWKGPEWEILKDEVLRLSSRYEAERAASEAMKELGEQSKPERKPTQEDKEVADIAMTLLEAAIEVNKKQVSAESAAAEAPTTFSLSKREYDYWYRHHT